MANIKKNFNFRNGVQVDDDNLLVTSTGLVGIGTTVPTEALDVRGNVKIIGDATITNATVGVLTITEVAPTQIIGAGVSIQSGIVTAQGTGIVTFFGDARFLQGMPTSQWEDTNAGFAVSSIYNQGSTVGIATTNPKATLQIGDNPDPIGGVSGRGVGISSVGNINASGIVTASRFVGPLTGDVTGNVTGNLTGNVNSSGLSTFSDLLVNRNLEVSGISTLGITTVTNLTAEQVNVSGMSTMSGGITIENLTIGHLMGSTVGIAASINTNNPGTHLHLNAGGSAPNATTFIKLLQNTRAEKDLTVIGSISAQQVSGSVLGSFDQLSARQATFGGSGGFLSAQNGLSAKNLRLATTGTDSTITSVGTPLVIGPSPGGANTNLKGPVLIDGVNAQLTVAGSLFFFDSGQTVALGIGTLSAANDIQVRNSGNAEIQVTSDTGVAGLTVGREAGTSNTNNAEFRYGGGSGAIYSTSQSLDIINYGTHNFNYYLSASNPSGAVGDFHWHKGLNNTRMMTLTNTGLLGIGETQPQTTLHVQGISTVTGNSFVGGTLEIGGNSVIGGNLSVSGTLNSNITGNVVGNVTGNVTGSVNDTGISTFASVGIGTDTQAAGVELDGSQITAVFNRVSVGSTDPESGADFKNCGAGVTDRFLIPPTVTTTERNSITTPVDGGLIFNSTSNRLEVYLQNSWVGIATVV